MLAVAWLGGTVDQLTSGGLLSARPCGQRVDSLELRASWHLGGYVAALNLTGAGTGRLAPVWSIGRLESEAVNLIWTQVLSMSQPPSVAPAVTAQPPRADGHMGNELLPPTLNASCPSRCHAKHPPARPEVPATYAQAAVTTT